MLVNIYELAIIVLKILQQIWDWYKCRMLIYKWLGSCWLWVKY